METVVTPQFRVSYPHIFKPKMNDLNGKAEYSIVALFKKGEDLTTLKLLAQKAIIEKWGEDKKKWPVNLKSPFRDQGEKAKDNNGVQVFPDGYVEGAVFVNLKSTQRPGVVDQSVQDILDESQIYAGCWCRASVKAFAYDQKGNRGISFGLLNVQKTKDDDSLSGRTSPQDDFAPITEAKEAGAPANALDLFS